MFIILVSFEFTEPYPAHRPLRIIKEGILHLNAAVIYMTEYSNLYIILIFFCL